MFCAHCVDNTPKPCLFDQTRHKSLRTSENFTSFPAVERHWQVQNKKSWRTDTQTCTVALLCTHTHTHTHTHILFEGKHGIRLCRLRPFFRVLMCFQYSDGIVVTAWQSMQNVQKSRGRNKQGVLEHKAHSLVERFDIRSDTCGSEY